MRHSDVVRVAATASSMVFLLACSGTLPSRAAPTAGFWYASDLLTLPAYTATKLGGPLTTSEMESIQHLSRGELDAAFSELRIRIASQRDAFWRVEVVQALRRRGNQPLPSAGESMALGPLGGRGAVDFVIVALRAVHYAPAGAARQQIIEGIGRGIGRVAVHEFMHQMLGAAATHNGADEHSYEYPSPDRAAQYYGDLHWSTAWPALNRKFGK